MESTRRGGFLCSVFGTVFASGIGIGDGAPADKLHIVSGTADFRFGAPNGADGMQIQSGVGGHSPALWLKHSATGGRTYGIRVWARRSRRICMWPCRSILPSRTRATAHLRH